MKGYNKKMLTNKIKNHTKKIAMMLADMAHFIPQEVVAYIAQKNNEQFSELNELFRGKVEISHYLFGEFQQSICVFPGVRRPPARVSSRGKGLKYDNAVKAILDSNDVPRHIWCFLYLNRPYGGETWKKNRFCEFEIAHLFPHKDDDESENLMREIFHQVGKPESFFTHFTGAGNTILLPKGSARPTDTLKEIKIAFLCRYVELYGEGYLGDTKGFKEDIVPSWYDVLRWNKPDIPSGWQSNIDSLIQYRTKFLYDKLSGG